MFPVDPRERVARGRAATNQDAPQRFPARCFCPKRHAEDRHGAFFEAGQGRHRGSITGFDRLLFRGILRSISYVEGLNYFIGSQAYLFKGFGAFVEKFSAGARKQAEAIALRAGRPFLYLGGSRSDKEKLAREVRERDRIKEGLMCILACMEPCPSFSIRRDREKRQLHLVAPERKCLHLYFYLLNRDFGLVHVRLQIWLPLSIEVCVNGREWLAFR